MLGQLIEFIEMKSNLRKTKSNGGNDLKKTTIWKRLEKRMASLLRKAGVNG